MKALIIAVLFCGLSLQVAILKPSSLDSSLMEEADYDDDLPSDSISDESSESISAESSDSTSDEINMESDVKQPSEDSKPKNGKWVLKSSEVDYYADMMDKIDKEFGLKAPSKTGGAELASKTSENIVDKPEHFKAPNLMKFASDKTLDKNVIKPGIAEAAAANQAKTSV